MLPSHIDILFLATEEVKHTASLANSQNSLTPMCPTPGCHGVGNIKGPRYPTHNTLDACPYSPKNISSDSLIPDRLQGKLKFHEGQRNEEDYFYG